MRPTLSSTRLDQMTKCASTSASIRSPMKEAIMPPIRSFRLEGSGVIPSNAIQGFAKSAGEYQIAPRTQRITAEPMMARWFR